MSYSFHLNSRRAVCLAACAWMLAGSGGCTLFRNAGTGTHMDAPRDRPSSTKAAKKHDMLVEVTTDANGDVINIEFKRSSGMDPVDAHVAEEIHKSWPKVASTVSLAEVSFSMTDGFTQPRMISSHPVAAVAPVQR